MKSNDPSRARVVAEISIGDAVSAIEHFAANFPEDRHSTYISRRLFAAAVVIERKADLTKKLLFEKSAAAKSVTKTVIGTMPNADPFCIGGCLSGRSDSSKPNPCFGSREMAERDASETALNKLRRLASRMAPESAQRWYIERETLIEDEAQRCADCLMVSSKAEPMLHTSNCPALLVSLGQTKWGGR